MKNNLPELNTLINQLISKAKLRPKSMIMTIFGDVVSLYGGSSSLMTLIAIAKNFGFSEGLIRTSVNRLKQKGWLNVRKNNNRSHYSLTEKAQLLFDEAQKKIYYHIQPYKEEYWTLVYTGDAKNKLQSNKFEKELVFKGFAYLGRRFLFSPKPQGEVYDVARKLDLESSILIFKANISKNTDRLFVKQLMEEHWHIQTLVEAYEKFNTFFVPILEIIKMREQEVSDKHMLTLRLILIHEYRKMILKDPNLPQILLPSYWPYDISYQLCSRIYQEIYFSSSRYLTSNFFKLEPIIQGRFSGDTYF